MAVEPGKISVWPFAFINGGGEMGALMRNYPWEETPLGSPASWPQSLQTTLGLLLHSAFPMFLFWGRDLICFYNDAYRPSLGVDGKHPALGKPGREVWPEIWDFIGPLIDQVIEKQEAVWFEDQLVPIYRNGGLEDVYWTFSYSPAYGDDGEVSGVLVTCMETTDKVLTNRKLIGSEETLKNIILKAPVAMCMLMGPDHLIEVTNEKMLNLWGKSAGDIEKRPVFEALPELKSKELSQLLDNVFMTGSSYRSSEKPINFERNNEVQTLLVDFVYEPHRDINGSIIGVICIAIDVTEQVRARLEIEKVVSERTRELAEANNSLRLTNLELEQFAFIASHDLQEPVRKVSTFTHLLEQSLGEVNERARGYLRKIRSSTDRMHHLIKDVLSYSSLTVNSALYTATDLNRVMADVQADLELAIEREQARIFCGPLPVVRAIPAQMIQLFGNLLANALKFSRADKEPEIHISATKLTPEEQARNPSLRKDLSYHAIRISDNGIGFHQKHAKNIFNIFQRLHGIKEYPGTGIGLALCAKIVQTHDGDITAESEPGKGASFIVVLPAPGG